MSLIVAQIDDTADLRRRNPHNPHVIGWHSSTVYSGGFMGMLVAICKLRLQYGSRIMMLEVHP